MALSEHEQAQLDELEARLALDDPRLAHLLRGTTPRPARSPRRLAFAGVGMLVGLVGLVAGLQLHPVVSMLAFVVMMISAVSALDSWPRGHAEERRAARAMHPSNAAHRQQLRAGQRLDDQGHDQHLL